jgi:hypothetical protein
MGYANLSRTFIRISLAIAFVAAIAIPFLALSLRGADKPETWTVAAAALAVLTSVVSTWSSRRVLELQEDAQRPNPVPSFDFTSRYGLVLFRISNTGDSAAHDIFLEWDVSLTNSSGQQIGFQKIGDDAAIGLLLPRESITQIIDVPHELIARLPDTEYTGFVVFSDALGRQHRRRFRLNARQYIGTPTHDEEWPRTHHELQKIPEELHKIRQALGR